MGRYLVKLESGQSFVISCAALFGFTSKCTEQCSTGLFRWKNFAIEARTGSLYARGPISLFLAETYGATVWRGALRPSEVIFRLGVKTL